MNNKREIQNATFPDCQIRNVISHITDKWSLLEHFDPIKYIPNGVFLTGFFSNFPTQKIIDSLFRLINEQHIKPLYAKVFRMDEIAEAHTFLEKGGAGGKIVLKMI